MKLTVDKGELDLPENFSFEIEQNSAFFSDDGTASLAATIPATPEDLSKLGFPDRIGRATVYDNSFPVIIRHGIFQKKGALVVGSVSDSGISCSVALDDSEFYSQYKEKNLKDLFGQKVMDDFSEIEDWYAWLFRVYKGEVINEFCIIPVAVNYNESEGTYQVNNEPVDDNSDGIWPLAYEARLVQEGGEEVSVPSGYGIAPFLKLGAFFRILFELCGYTVSRSFFSEKQQFSSLILLHNCSDVICNGKINYSDLVPNKSVSEILEWLQQKFHAQIVVHSSKKTVDIILLEDILAGSYDKDLTDRLLNDIKYTFSASSRVIISPDTSLDRAAPAAETLQDLIDKYGGVTEFTETSDWDLSGLLLNLATGMYYEQRLSFGHTGRDHDKRILVGSNYFKYDRRNSEDTEEFSPSDLMPPMVTVDTVLMPYIGERVHRNTSYNDSEKDSDQEIIIADYAGLSNTPVYEDWHGRLPYTAAGHYYYATTQKYDNTGKLRPGKIALTPEGIFFECFQRYNKILLNNAVEIEGSFDFTPDELLQYDIYSMKLFRGQLMLPTYLDYEIGKNIRCVSSKFLLVKNYSDGADDKPIVAPSPKYKWQLNQSELEIMKEALTKQHCKNPGDYISYDYAEDDPYVSGESDFYLPPPNRLGQRSILAERKVSFTYHRGAQGSSPVGTYTLKEWYDSVAA